MKTIENIRVEKTFFKRQKDVFGNVYREPYTKSMPRPVQIVPTGTRFGYFIVDLILNIILQFGVSFLFMEFIPASDKSGEFQKLVSFLFYYGYYFVFEQVFGQTPGKMLLGYVVINKYAQLPTVSETAIRTLCRLIPFEGLSCFNEKGGWHDRFSNTYVVSKEERQKLLTLISGLSETGADSDLLDR